VKLKITKNSSNEIAPDFAEGEFFTHSADYSGDYIYLDSELVQAAQYVRDYINAPVEINSSARTVFHQSTLSGGAANSQHVDENFENTGVLGSHAIDIDMSANNLAIVCGDIIHQGPLYQALVDLGIKGFGVYNGFIHLDTGLKPSAYRSSIAFWNNRDLASIAPDGSKTFTPRTISFDDQDGIKGLTPKNKAITVIVIALILFAGWYYRKPIAALFLKH